MNDMVNNFIDGATQCWGCPVFDRLFGVVSNAAAGIYDRMVQICWVLFAVLFVGYIIWAVFKRFNPKNPDTSDPFFTKTVVRVVINSLFVGALLGAGLMFPRFITQITFEPVAKVALIYNHAILKNTPEFVDEHVTYQPVAMPDTGFYRPQLRDTVISLMKTTITQFQSFIKLGVAVMDHAFTWRAILGIGALFRHIIMFAIGLYLFYGFFKLFFRFCFYFVDVIIAMAMFAFFFPISLMLMAFRGGDMPAWMSSLGTGLGGAQIKKLINAIITLASAVIAYTVIMVIIARFFTDANVSSNELMNAITSGTVFESDLSDGNFAVLTLAGSVILVYVLNYIYAQIPQITKMILGTFGVQEEDGLSKQMADDAEKLVGLVTSKIKSVGSLIANGGDKKETSDSKEPNKEGGKK